MSDGVTGSEVVERPRIAPRRAACLDVGSQRSASAISLENGGSRRRSKWDRKAALAHQKSSSSSMSRAGANTAGGFVEQGALGGSKGDPGARSWQAARARTRTTWLSLCGARALRTGSTGGAVRKALALVLDPGRGVGVDEAACDGDEAAGEEALVELPVGAVDAETVVSRRTRRRSVTVSAAAQAFCSSRGSARSVRRPGRTRRRGRAAEEAGMCGALW